MVGDKRVCKVTKEDGARCCEVNPRWGNKEDWYPSHCDGCKTPGMVEIAMPGEDLGKRAGPPSHPFPPLQPQDSLATTDTSNTFNLLLREE